MAITVRPGRPDELAEFARVSDASFGEARSPDEMDALRERIGDRFYVACDGDVIVGTSADYGFAMSVPGGEVAVGHVTEVGVLPTHRRRGILSALVRLQSDEALRRGEPVLALTASEGAIYHRFGYGLATLEADISLPTARAAFRLPVDRHGSVRLVSSEEAARTLPPVYERIRVGRPGGWRRNDAWWKRILRVQPIVAGEGPLFVAVHAGPGGTDGYALYRYAYERDSSGPRHTLRLIELMAEGPQATTELWRFLCDIDLVATVGARHQPAEHPLLHLLAEPRALGLRVVDGLWIRLLDVQAALERRAYGATDRLTFDLTDAVRPSEAGRWQLDSDGVRASVSRSDGPADVALDVSDLGAAYLGGTSFRTLADVGRTRELVSGAIARADALFRSPIAPWSPIVP